MKKVIKYLDYPLLISSIVLTLFGVLMIFSASSYSAVLQYKVSEVHFASRQLIILILLIFLTFLILIRLPVRFYTWISIPYILGCGALLIMLKTYGTISHSANSWIRVGFLTIQPSEYAKSAIILFMACLYSRKKSFENYMDIFIPLFIPIVIAGLVFIEPDRGTALIILAIIAFIFLSLPISSANILKTMKILIGVGLLSGLLVVSFNQNLFKGSEAVSRLQFRNPCSRYLDDTGYQVCNGYIAMNNGGLTGVGLGKSTQKYLYLPEAHTDFIFAIITEEFGLIGGGIVLLTFMFILYRLLKIAWCSKTLSGSIIAFGTFAYILIHILINLGGSLALIPLTGVPLPFLSYGGSFLINLFILLAICQRVAIETKMPRRK